MLHGRRGNQYKARKNSSPVMRSAIGIDLLEIYSMAPTTLAPGVMGSEGITRSNRMGKETTNMAVPQWIGNIPLQVVRRIARLAEYNISWNSRNADHSLRRMDFLFRIAGPGLDEATPYLTSEHYDTKLAAAIEDNSRNGVEVEWDVHFEALPPMLFGRWQSQFSVLRKNWLVGRRGSKVVCCGTRPLYMVTVAPS